jgi:hypothetical protein
MLCLHTPVSNNSSGHTAVPLEIRNSSEVNSHFRILSYPLGTDHAQKTQSLYCCMAQTTQKTCHVSDCEFICPLAALDVAGTT